MGHPTNIVTPVYAASPASGRLQGRWPYGNQPGVFSNAQQAQQSSVAFGSGSAGLAATFVSGVLTVTGNIPAKSQAAPLFYRNWSTHNQNDNYLAAGFDFISEDAVSGSSGKICVEKLSTSGITPSHGGFKLDWTQGGSVASFAIIGIKPIVAPSELFISHYIRADHTVGAASSFQIKGPRFGSFGDEARRDNQAGNAYYGSTTGPKFYCSHFDEAGITQQTMSWRGRTRVNPSGYSDGFCDNPEAGAAYSTFVNNGWKLWEIYGRLNSNPAMTNSNADGEFIYAVDGKIQGRKSFLYPDAQGSRVYPRESSAEFLDWAVLIDGLTNYTPSPGAIKLLYSNMYVDNTRARVCFINASTVAAATSLMPVPASVWAAGSSGTIQANIAANLIPSGHNWIAVFDGSNIAQVAAL